MADCKDDATLFEALTAAGIPTDHHESDLYFPVTPTSTAILAQYPAWKASATTFVIQPEHADRGQLWYDVPFAYDPYWYEQG